MSLDKLGVPISRTRWPLSYLGAWSRGWTAQFWGLGKQENPFRTDQVLYRELWLDGWRAAGSVNAPQKARKPDDQ